MANLHSRKILVMYTTRHDSSCDDDCPPPPPHQLQPNHPLSPLTVFLICTLTATFTFLSYIIILKTCRRRRRTPFQPANLIHDQQPSHDHDHDHDHDHALVFHPVWLINTIGLDQSVIDSIKIFNYKKEHTITTVGASDHCAVCLSMFQEQERLRLLPQCSHAFHVTCIDTWLRSHKNCPLCRAPVDQMQAGSSAHEQTQTPFGVLQNHTTGVENTDQQIIRSENEGRVQSDIHLTDLSCQLKQQMKRSVSVGSLCLLDQGSGDLVVSSKTSVVPNRRGSSSSLSICGQGRKTSSFRLSSDNRSIETRGNLKSLPF